jgi:hypothetical protein
MTRSPTALLNPSASAPSAGTPLAAALGVDVAAAIFGGSRGSLAAGFGEGTLLATPGGAVPVEMLRPGDRLSTPDGGSLRLRARSSRAATSGAVLLPAESLGQGLPRRAIVVHPSQSLLWAGQPLAALGLVCGGAVRRCSADGMLHGLVLERPGAVLAEGLAFALRPPLRPEHDVRVGASLAAARRVQGLHAAGGGLKGDVALDDAGTLRGWALDTAKPGAPVLLEVLLNDVTIGFTLADEARPDLAMLGIGDGACGFALALQAGALQAEASSSAPGLLRIHAVASGATLPGTPLLLDIAQHGMPPVKAGHGASVSELATLLGQLGRLRC